MRRRSEEQRGFVNFPVDSTEYRNSGEGGMFVQLAVEDDNENFGQEWTLCCGVPNTRIVMSEVLVDGADKEKYHFPEAEDLYAPVEGLEPGYAQRAVWAWRASSIDYLAVIMLGTTGWSGWNEKLGKYWECTLEDLTEEGRSLHTLMEKLYPGCKLHLLTWLDT